MILLEPMPVAASTLIAASAVEEWLLRRGTGTLRVNPPADAGTLVLLRVMTFIGVSTGVLAAVAFRGGAIRPGHVAVYIGAFLIWTGTALRCWSVFALGRFFSPSLTIEPAHRLITTGPYRYMRHPSYLGGLLVLAGTGLILRNILSLVACVCIPLIGYARRIAVEEALLSRRFPQTYPRYAATVGGLSPLPFRPHGRIDQTSPTSRSPSCCA